MWLCSVHLNGSSLHYLSIQSVQDVLPKVVPAFEEHVIIFVIVIFQGLLCVLETFFFFIVIWKT